MNDDDRLIYAEWDALTASEQARLDARLAASPELREARERAGLLRADLRALRSEAVAAPPPLDLERLAASAPPRRRDHRWLAAAAVALIGAGGWMLTRRAPTPEPLPVAEAPGTAPTGAATPAPTAAVETVEVGFSLRATDAAVVAVAGDFNDWQPQPMQRSTGGLWTGQTRLPPGRYAYMYVVDGRWLTPPDARRTQDDGFGARNGVLDLLEPFDA